jgi:regulatory protein
MERWSGGDASAPERTDGVAPVIPLFGAADAPTRHPARVNDDPAPAAPVRRSTNVRFVPDADDAAGEVAAPSAADVLADAERMLTRKLRTRSLSVAEAKTAAAGHLVDTDVIEGLIAEFVRKGYLDDAALAEQVVHAGITRKRQGRRAIGGELSRRGIPRSVADAALASLPDDDDDRALEFARTKARSLGRVDREAALRRLVGQLSRRGFPSSTAMSAARTALDELH